MPTLVERYVNTASTAGGDGTTNATSGTNRAYASLSEWNSNEATNLISADQTHTVYCDGSGGVDTTGQVDLVGWTTDATRTVTITASGAQRCNGESVAKSGTGYKLTYNASSAIRFRTDFPIIDGIEIESSSSLMPIRAYVGGGSEVHTITNCLIISTYSGSNPAITTNSGGLNELVIRDTIVIAANCRAIDSRSYSTATLDHVGCYGASSNLGYVCSSESTITNSWGFGFASGCFWTGGSPTGSHNASSDTTATTKFTSSQASLTDTNEFTAPSTTLTTADFSLLSTSNLVDAGTGTFSVDIAGNAQSGTADIGPFEYQSGGTGTGTTTLFLSVAGEGGLASNGGLAGPKGGLAG